MTGNLGANLAFIALMALMAFEFYEIVIADRFGMIKDPFVLPL